jgi:hypothetical protein
MCWTWANVAVVVTSCLPTFLTEKAFIETVIAAYVQVLKYSWPRI